MINNDIFLKLFREYDGSHVLITGCTGFFGKWILNLFGILYSLGCVFSLTIVSRNPNKFLCTYPEYRCCAWITWVESDIRDLYSIPNEKVDFVIHAAADTNVLVDTSRLELFDSIVTGSRRVFDLAVRCGARRILLTGSGAQYGYLSSCLNVTEDYLGTNLSNLSPNYYIEAKRYQETLAVLYSEEYQIDVVLTRCFSFSGAGLFLDGHFAIGNFVRDALYGDEILISSSGESVRSYMDGYDLSIWLLVLLTTGKSRETYNVGSDQAVTIKDLAQRIISRLAPNKNIRILGQAECLGRSYYVPDISKSRRLGLDVWTSLDESIDDMAAWAAKTYKK